MAEAERRDVAAEATRRDDVVIKAVRRDAAAKEARRDDEVAKAVRRDAASEAARRDDVVAKVARRDEGQDDDIAVAERQEVQRRAVITMVWCLALFCLGVGLYRREINF
mmetsp:Transcript_11865/g.24704  ORF Transcript_11865/g.24704 Transcript_11865/m.24704 type:complete len:109 (-) Transcript_11865:8-334(-)